jgi:hypothetical protein
MGKKIHRTATGDVHTIGRRRDSWEFRGVQDLVALHWRQEKVMLRHEEDIAVWKTFTNHNDR